VRSHGDSVARDGASGSGRSAEPLCPFVGQGFRLLDVEVDDVDAPLRALVRRAAVPPARLQADVEQLLHPEATPVVR
jgi:hypothetical protein